MTEINKYQRRETRKYKVIQRIPSYITFERGDISGRGVTMTNF